MPFGLLILLAWVLTVGYGDLRKRRIANRLVYPFLLLAAGWLAATGESLVGVAWPHALAGVGGALTLTIPGHLKGALGGGDVKLLAALGLCLGLVPLLALVALTAALLAVWHLLLPRLPAKTRGWLALCAPGLRPAHGGAPRTRPVPDYAFAPFVALALMLLLLLALGIAG